MANSDSFLSPYEIFLVAQENIKRNFIILAWNLCFVYSLESPHRGDSYEYTQHAISV